MMDVHYLKQKERERESCHFKQTQPQCDFCRYYVDVSVGIPPCSLTKKH